MDITFGIKTEAAAYLAEMADLPPPILLGGYEIKLEYVPIESHSDSSMELDWIDDDKADDLHKKLIMEMKYK